eukprot:sb/3479018/
MSFSNPNPAMPFCKAKRHPDGCLRHPTQPGREKIKIKQRHTDIRALEYLKGHRKTDIRALGTTTLTLIIAEDVKHSVRSKASINLFDLIPLYRYLS